MQIVNERNTGLEKKLSRLLERLLEGDYSDDVSTESLELRLERITESLDHLNGGDSDLSLAHAVCGGFAPMRYQLDVLRFMLGAMGRIAKLESDLEEASCESRRILETVKATSSDGQGGTPAESQAVLPMSGWELPITREWLAESGWLLLMRQGRVLFYELPVDTLVPGTMCHVSLVGSEAYRTWHLRAVKENASGMEVFDERCLTQRREVRDALNGILGLRGAA